MAEVVAGLLTSAVIQIASNKLSSAITEQADLVCSFGDDLEDMKDMMESMEAVLQDAEKRSIKEKSVQLWLKRLKHASLDISDMMDEYRNTQTTTKMVGMFSCLSAARRKIVLANKMKSTREKLRKINKDRESFKFTENANNLELQQNIDPRETMSTVKEAPMLGRDGEKKKITDCLFASQRKDRNVILPIYGLGGVGKSTLAQLVYNDTRVKQYNKRVWVYVSQRFDLKDIGRSIISQLSEGQQNLDKLEMINQCLDELLLGKKILIVLDDIWEDDVFELDKLKTMLHMDKKGSMVDVILTTRSESIAKIFCANEPHKLQPLEDDVCWNIIERCSGFKDKNNKGELKKIGWEIAKKCGGVPLAAEAIGYMLRLKDLHGWREVNSSDIWNDESSGVNNSQNMKVLPSLKLSYERMPPILRLCFSYCVIFPKGHDIFEDDLVHQWLAFDFIKKPSEGKECINQLLGMFFLQRSKLPSDYPWLSRYTMHDLVHDLATSVIGDELTVIDAVKKSNHTGQQKYCWYAELTNYDGQAKLSDILPKKVRSLHFSSSSKLFGPRHGSFSFAKCLRVLDFSRCRNITLPSSIGHLKKLRCLIAPQVLNEMLPESITQLSELQYLNMRGSSKMSTLPELLDKLTGLIYFGLSHCSGITALPESLGGLITLTKLHMSRCSRITALPESLGRLTSLTKLDISECSGITALPESLGRLTSLTKLYISGCSGITAFPESLGHLTSLTELWMSNCSGITALPETLGRLTSLTQLWMSRCSGITALPESLGRLTSLTQPRCHVVLE